MKGLLLFIFIVVVVATPIIVLMLIFNYIKKIRRKRLLVSNPKKFNDIFITDLQNFNDADWKLTKSEELHSTYHKQLRKKEVGLFNSITARVFFEENEIHYVMVKKLTKEDIPYIEMLIKNLLKLLGEDSSNKKFLSKGEKIELKQGDYFWTGRTWQGENYLVKLEAYKNEGLTLAVSILGG